MNHFKTVLACLIATAALSTAVVAAPDREAIEARIHKINPKAKISSITETPVEGMNEILADGTVTYISDDGRYLFHGNLIDLDLRMNLTEQAGAGIRKDLLNQVPASEKIRLAPPPLTVTLRPEPEISTLPITGIGAATVIVPSTANVTPTSRPDALAASSIAARKVQVPAPVLHEPSPGFESDVSPRSFTT